MNKIKYCVNDVDILPKKTKTLNNNPYFLSINYTLNLNQL